VGAGELNDLKDFKGGEHGRAGKGGREEHELEERLTRDLDRAKVEHLEHQLKLLKLKGARQVVREGNKREMSGE
jgi:hypothetical protein